MTKDDKKLIKQKIDQCAAELYQYLQEKYSGKNLSNVLYYLQDYTTEAFDNSNNGIKRSFRRYQKCSQKEQAKIVEKLPENNPNNFLPNFDELAGDL